MVSLQLPKVEGSLPQQQGTLLAAQSDSARTIKGTAAPKHAARSWLWGTMHAESIRVQQHILEVLQQTYPQTIMYPDLSIQISEQQIPCFPAEKQHAA